MIFKILNQTGSPITLNGTTYANNMWVDIVPYWAFGGLESTQNDVDGANAGRSISTGNLIRDKIAEKEKCNFVSVPMLHSDCVALKNLVRPQEFTVSTDYFSGTTQTYTMYSNNRVLTYIKHNVGDTDLCKIAFPLIEV